MDLIPASAISASALTAEKVRLDLIAENIANVNTTRTPNGGPYQRKVPTFEAAMDIASGAGHGVRISSINQDTTPGPRVYNPSHPDADANGFVQMPNVNLAYEMVDLITASRSYEANLAVIRNARQMVSQALSIGRM
ncbi:MAG: flagellar basal body rod protein FlgC [Chthoniobacterales bacterium]|nr:flagellar basal body rod protein FlgC [Chthoniobacterales bacterium]